MTARRPKRNDVENRTPAADRACTKPLDWDDPVTEVWSLTDGRIEIDNNAVERTIRPIALNRKNALFAGHDAGAQNWAILATLIETCKLNAIDPHAWMSNTLTAIVNGHKQSRIGELLPWNYDRAV